MRLIDADRLETVLSETVMVIIRDPKTDKEACVTAVFDEFGKIIHNAPIIDALPVVRCKDCKWWKTNYSWNGKEHKVCVIEPYEPVRKPDDYCSYGERKDDV